VQTAANGAYAIKVATKAFARNVNLHLDLGAGIDGTFDDNDFDLLPGESATVTFKPATPTTATLLKAALRTRTIADSY